jgi:hypothetical protein
MVQSLPVKALLHRIFPWIRRLLQLMVIIGVATLILSASSMPPPDQTERVRYFTRNIEFDYVSWMANALRVKAFEGALETDAYLSDETRRQMIIEYMNLVRQMDQIDWRIRAIYADPNVTDPQAASASYRQDLETLILRRDQLAPVAESILQDQISTVVEEMGLGLGGQPLPPVLYHSTPLPLALIVSPRNVIRQDEDISLLPDMPIDEQVELEERVDRALNVSSLVVNIGGVGLYPTMVMQTNDLPWLTEVIAHEWTHNYLTLRPLGASYMESPELRVMNETTAAIAGKEIGLALLKKYYAELVPPPPAPKSENPPAEPPAFDFRKEMHITRLTVDQMLGEGKIEEAEAYMEARRQVFWENGYRGLRKLNQAYFAFNGAYADEPGGAAGATEDPVGSAVRALRAQSPSLADFLYRISWMLSFEQLQGAVKNAQ